MRMCPKRAVTFETASTLVAACRQMALTTKGTVQSAPILPTHH